MPSGRPHTVAVAAFDGLASYEFGTVVEVFGRPEYDLRVCAPGREDVFAAADTQVVVAVPDVEGEVPPRLVAALRDGHERGARVVSICSGVFALAAAGLLDGREATTHWQYTELLRRRHPRILVRPDVLYVDGGDVLTGAGNAAALERHLLVPAHREGDQAQVAVAAVREPAAGDGVERAMAWALDHLASPITVAELARRAHLAPRTFLRHFAQRTGTSPLRWVVAQRIAASLPLLAHGVLPVEEVGAAVGIASPATFRHHFTRAMKMSPSAYRRAARGG